jgi:hypothetical protein
VLLTAVLVASPFAAPVAAADPNQPPVAVDDPSLACGNTGFGGAFPIPEDPKEPMTLALSCAPLVNDSDPDGDVITPELVADASHGAATIWGGSDENFNFATYMPDDDYSTQPGNIPGGAWESDVFRYRVTDGQAWSNPATYRLWVAPINDPPTFTPGPSLVVGTVDGGAHATQWATDIDPGPGEGDQHVSFEVVDIDVTGVPNLFLVPPAIDDDGVLTFTPGPGETGLAQVTVRAVDDGGVDDWNVSSGMLREQPDDSSDPVTFEIVVSNHAPVANDDPSSCEDCFPVYGMFVEDAHDPTFWHPDSGLLGNDTDMDGDVLTGEVVDQPAHGTAAWDTQVQNGVPKAFVSYIPDPEWSTPPGDIPGGTWFSDTFTYRASDGLAWSDLATVSLWVAPINDAPTFDFKQNVTVDRNSGPASVSWATNIDPGPNEDGQTVSFEVSIESSTNAALFAVPPAVDGNGVLTFTPGLTQSGSAVIHATAKDDGGLEDWGVPDEQLNELPDDTSDTIAFEIVVAGAASDTTAPTVGSLARSLPAQAIGTSSVKVALSWKGEDVGTGVASYRLERCIGSGAWAKVTLPTPTTKSITATLTIDTAYSYRVRATDRAGNVGAWATFPVLNPKRIQDTSSLVTYTGTWTKVSNSSLSGGSARYASSTSRRAKVAFTGQEIALIATRRTTGGRAEIRVDGVVVGMVDLGASATQYRRLAFRKGFASSASHTLEVRPLGDGRVEIDAFIVLR